MATQDRPASMARTSFSQGSRIADYLLEEQIGDGGMAVVFCARDERLDRTVALKILAPALAADEGFRQRFIRESRAAAAVDHPHIIPVFEAGEASGVLFIAMRLVPGGDVRELVSRHGALPSERAAGIVAQAASALDAAHSRGLVHRDVKPANMLLDKQPDVNGGIDHLYLSDFGLSKTRMHTAGLTRSGTFLGTLDYISPEQIEGKAVDGRADQYSLACAAYELLTGVPPFQRDDAMAVMYAQLHAAPPPLTGRRPELPEEADHVFARALAKSPSERYDSCAQFSDSLRLALGVLASAEGAHNLVSAGPPQPAAGPLTELVIPWSADAAGGHPAAAGARVPAMDRTDGATQEAVRLGKLQPASVRSEPAQEARSVLTGSASPSASAQHAGRFRRRPALAALISACILVAAGIVSGAILLHSKDHAAALHHSHSGPPRHTARHTAQRQRHAAGRSPTATGQSPLQSSAGYRLVAPLTPGGSTASISSVSWNATGTLVAVSDKNGSTYLWNAATVSSRGPALPGPAAAYATAFSPSDAVLATGYKNGTTYLWSTTTGGLLVQLRDPGPARGKEVDSVAFSPDGRTLATADGNGYTNLWRLGTAGRTAALSASLADPAGTGVYSVAFSTQGTLATGDYHGHGYIWDATSGTPTTTFSVPGGYCTVSTICDAVSALAFSSDGTVLAAGNLSGNAELWSIPGQHGATLPANSQGSPAIWGLSFSGSHILATASSDGRSYLWYVNPANLTVTAAGTLSDPDSGPDGIGAVAFSADGRYLVTGDTNGSAYLWRIS